MDGNGTRLIPRRIGLLAVRTLLASLVMWGAVLEMTRQSSWPITAVRSRDKAPEARPGVRYTMTTVRTTWRGWPFEFSFRTNLDESWAPDL